MPGGGLREFKRGWSTGTRPAYLCGRILQPQRYAELAEERGPGERSYFPAYRAGEFGPASRGRRERGGAATDPAPRTRSSPPGTPKAALRALGSPCRRRGRRRRQHRARRPRPVARASRAPRGGPSAASRRRTSAASRWRPCCASAAATSCARAATTRPTAASRVARPLIPDAMAEFFDALPPAQAVPVLAAAAEALRRRSRARGARGRSPDPGRLRASSRAASRRRRWRLLGSAAEPSNAVAASIELVARGIVARASWAAPTRPGAASRRPFERGVPLAALLARLRPPLPARRAATTRPTAASRSRRPLDPGRDGEFFDALPPAQICRYSPLTAPPALARAEAEVLLAAAREAGARAGARRGRRGVRARGVRGPLGALERGAAADSPACCEFAREHALEVEELVAPKDVEMRPPPVFGGRSLRTRSSAGRDRSSSASSPTPSSRASRTCSSPRTAS